MDMTLREVCTATNVSRRAVQGYEKAGLVRASGKTNRGYLIYNEETQERIRQIRLYQQLGFSIKEITEIIDAPNEVIKAALEVQVVKLQEQGENIEVLIGKANELIGKL